MFAVYTGYDFNNVYTLFLELEETQRVKIQEMVMNILINVFTSLNELFKCVHL